MQIIFNNTTEEILPLKKDLTLVETTIFQHRTAVLTMQ